MLLKNMSLFVTNKVFRWIIVWLPVDLHILHTVTTWQATVSTKTRMEISLSRTKYNVQGSFSWLYQHLHTRNARQAMDSSSFRIKLSSERLHVLSLSRIYTKEVEARQKSKFHNIVTFIMIEALFILTQTFSRLHV